MKAKSFASLVGLLLAVVPEVHAIPPLDIIVSDANSKPAFRGVSNRDGTFATGKLAPGNYVVRFHSQHSFTKDDHYLLILSAGKKTLISNRLDGASFAASGVAANMEVAKTGVISGQVADAEELEKAGVKVVNGRRYRWIKGTTGDNFGGRWVEEATYTRDLKQLSQEGMRRLQDRSGQGNMGANEHGPQHEKPGGG